MPATTRSSTRSSPAADITFTAFEGPRFVVIPAPANNNKKWTTTDQRTLIRMCRQTSWQPDIMVATLGRSEESIRYRLAKIIHEHLDGRTDEASIREVSDWLLPN